MSSVTVREHQAALYELLCEFDRICRKHGIRYTLFAGTLLGAVRHGGFIPWDDDADVLMLREDYEKFLEVAPTETDPDQFFVQKEYSEHWPMFFSKLRLQGTACVEKYVPKDFKTHMGVYIDIFPCDCAADCGWTRKSQFLASRAMIAKSLERRGYATDSKRKKLLMALARFIPQGPTRAFVLLRTKRHSEYVHTFFGAGKKYEKNVFPRAWMEETQPMAFENGIFTVTAHYDELLTLLYGDYTVLPTETERASKTHAVIVDLSNSYEAYAEYQRSMTITEYTKSIR
jgi:lipopolysaccharide cholinephosphotransferase